MRVQTRVPGGWCRGSSPKDDDGCLTRVGGPELVMDQGSRQWEVVPEGVSADSGREEGFLIGDGESGIDHDSEDLRWWAAINGPRVGVSVGIILCNQPASRYSRIRLQ